LAHLISQWMMPWLWTQKMASATSLRMGMIHLSAKPPVGLISVDTLPPAQYSVTIHIVGPTKGVDDGIDVLGAAVPETLECIDLYENVAEGIRQARLQVVTFVYVEDLDGDGLSRPEPCGFVHTAKSPLANQFLKLIRRRDPSLQSQIWVELPTGACEVSNLQRGEKGGSRYRVGNTGLFVARLSEADFLCKVTEVVHEVEIGDGCYGKCSSAQKSAPR